MPHPTKAGAFFDLNDAQITETRINPDEFLRAEKVATDQVRAVFRAGPSTYNPPRSSCCGAEEGSLCATDCDRRLAAEACHREAVALVAREYGWSERAIEQSYEDASPARAKNPMMIDRSIRTAVDRAREEARRKMGRCEHFMFPDACDAGCDPLEFVVGEELDRIGLGFGVRRALLDTDKVLRENIRAVRQQRRADTFAAFERTTGSFPNSFNSRPVEVQDLARELTARAAHVGVKVDPRETCEDLRERIEARDKLRQASQIRDAPRAPTPAEVRAENLRVGAELAKNPPAWAYPLGWMLAVSAHVEWRNNRAEPGHVGGEPGALGDAIGFVLRKYHDARLAGVQPEQAMRAQSTDPDGIDDWTRLLCAAYERGRCAPGGERLGRPA